MGAKLQPKSSAAVSQAKVAATKPQDADDRKMEQIRELMFGGVTRDFDRRLKELADKLDSDVSGAVNDMQKRVAALESQLSPQIEKLSTQLRQEAVARTSALDDVDVRFNQVLRTQRDEINAILQQHEDQSGAADVRMREALAELEGQIKNAVRAIKDSLGATREELSGEKLAREDLADMMAELSLRLRGKQGSSKGD